MVNEYGATLKNCAFCTEVVTDFFKLKTEPRCSRKKIRRCLEVLKLETCAAKFPIQMMWSFYKGSLAKQLAYFLLDPVVLGSCMEYLVYSFKQVFCETKQLMTIFLDLLSKFSMLLQNRSTLRITSATCFRSNWDVTQIVCRPNFVKTVNPKSYMLQFWRLSVFVVLMNYWICLACSDGRLWWVEIYIKVEFLL